MNQAALIDIVVVACDSGVLLEDCVARALDSAECASLTLVDNASSDGYPQRLAGRFAHDPRFRLLAMERNVGFGAGCNRGAERGQAGQVLLLNPDCLIARDSLSGLLAVLSADRRIGLLGADVRDAMGREERAARRRDPTPERLLADHGRALGLRGEGVQIARSVEDVQSVDACSGALMLLPRAVWQRIGGFDPQFFLHGEDLDLCRRVRLAGFRVAVANRVQVVHRQGSSSRARPLFVAWHKHLGLTRYLLRYQAQGLGPRLFIIAGIAVMFLLRGLPRALTRKS